MWAIMFCIWLIFLHACAPDAFAQQSGPTGPNARTIADKMFPGSKCGGSGITITWVDELSLADGTDLDGYATGVQINGVYVDGVLTGYTRETVTCDIMMDSSLRTMPMRACDVFVHEAGHLAGLDHSPDPNNVMHESSGTVPACHVQVQKRKHPRRYTRTRNQTRQRAALPRA